MGVFRCTKCKKQYSEKRFPWEETEEKHESVSSRTLHPPAPAPAPLQRRSTAGNALDELTLNENFSLTRRHTISNVEGFSESQDQGLPKVGDAIRATGTMTNVVGTAFGSTVAVACTPVSAVCGAIGFASGAYQLHKGVQTASGTLDPHLVAKGGTTALVGGSCMLLGATGLFLPALCLGVVGVSAAAMIDGNVDGLCQECREGREDKPEGEPLMSQRRQIRQRIGRRHSYQSREQQLMQSQYQYQKQRLIRGQRVLEDLQKSWEEAGVECKRETGTEETSNQME